VLLTISGCSHANDDKASSAGAPDAAGGTSSANGADGSATSGPKPRRVDLAVAKRPADDRQVISTAQLDLQSRDIDATVGRAAFAATARVTSAAVGLMLPFVPVALVWWLLRRRGTAKAPAS